MEKLKFQYDNITKKIMIPCSFEVIADKIKSQKTNMIFDTGAIHTLVHYSELDVMLSEEDLDDCEVLNICGIDSTRAIKFYKIHIDKFNMGNVSIRDVEIYITFDNRYCVNLLGMSILEHLNFAIDNKNKILTIQHISNGSNHDTIGVYERQIEAKTIFENQLNNNKF